MRRLWLLWVGPACLPNVGLDAPVGANAAFIEMEDGVQAVRVPLATNLHQMEPQSIGFIEYTLEDLNLDEGLIPTPPDDAYTVVWTEYLDDPEATVPFVEIEVDCGDRCWTRGLGHYACTDCRSNELVLPVAPEAPDEVLPCEDPPPSWGGCRLDELPDFYGAPTTCVAPTSTVVAAALVQSTLDAGMYETVFVRPGDTVTATITVPRGRTLAGTCPAEARVERVELEEEGTVRGLELGSVGGSGTVQDAIVDAAHSEALTFERTNLTELFVAGSAEVYRSDVGRAEVSHQGRLIASEVWFDRLSIAGTATLSWVRVRVADVGTGQSDPPVALAATDVHFDQLLIGLRARVDAERLVIDRRLAGEKLDPLVDGGSVFLRDATVTGTGGHSIAVADVTLERVSVTSTSAGPVGIEIKAQTLVAMDVDVDCPAKDKAVTLAEGDVRLLRFVALGGDEAVRVDELVQAFFAEDVRVRGEAGLTVDTTHRDVGVDRIVADCVGGVCIDLGGVPPGFEPPEERFLKNFVTRGGGAGGLLEGSARAAVVARHVELSAGRIENAVKGMFLVGQKPVRDVYVSASELGILSGVVATEVATDIFAERVHVVGMSGSVCLRTTRFISLADAKVDGCDVGVERAGDRAVLHLEETAFVGVAKPHASL